MEFYNDPISENILCAYRKSNSYHNCYHKHNGYEIYLLLNGDVNIYIDHSCYRITRGTLCFFIPDQLHLASCLDSSSYERATINIKPEIIETLSTSNTDLKKCFQPLPDSSHPIGLLNEQQICEYMELFQQVKASANLDYYGNDVKANAYLSLLLLLANQSLSDHAITPQNIMPSLISDIMQYVENHISEPLTLQQLSAHFYLNGKYLSRKFKEEMGITLQSYIISKRLSFAKSLLQRDYSVTDACFHSGFGSYSNFIRTFTDHVGISPGQYKQQVSKE